jgi:hypothetical protein
MMLPKKLIPMTEGMRFIGRSFADEAISDPRVYIASHAKTRPTAMTPSSDLGDLVFPTNRKQSNVIELHRRTTEGFQFLQYMI